MGPQPLAVQCRSAAPSGYAAGRSRDILRCGLQQHQPSSKLQHQISRASLQESAQQQAMRTCAAARRQLGLGSKVLGHRTAAPVWGACPHSSPQSSAGRRHLPAKKSSSPASGLLDPLTSPLKRPQCCLAAAAGFRNCCRPGPGQQALSADPSMAACFSPPSRPCLWAATRLACYGLQEVPARGSPAGH